MRSNKKLGRVSRRGELDEADAMICIQSMDTFFDSQLDAMFGIKDGSGVGGFNAGDGQQAVKDADTRGNELTDKEADKQPEDEDDDDEGSDSDDKEEEERLKNTQGRRGKEKDDSGKHTKEKKEERPGLEHTDRWQREAGKDGQDAIKRGGGTE